MQPLVAAAVLLSTLSLLLLRPVASWRIEPGGALSTAELADGSHWEQLQEERRSPPNIDDPDYFRPSAAGGHAGRAGEDGLAVFVARVHSNGEPTPFELRAGYFLKEGAVQEYVVPGDDKRRPYEQEVSVKLWGGGGGGCDGGRGEVTESLPEEGDDGALYFGEGAGGGYVEATFVLPVGDKVQISIGGGGMSSGSQPHSLGGKGGSNGGYPGKDWLSMSGGGGGGGMTTVSYNGTLIAAAYGGVGGGNTTYCRALGGVGASLRGRSNENGGYIDFDVAVADNDSKEQPVCPGIPAIVELSHDAATFSWNAGLHPPSKDYYVQRYTVHLAEGRFDEDNNDIVCSGEYSLHAHVQRAFDVAQNATTHIEGLSSASPYCVRIEAFSIEGLSLGAQILPFATKAAPVNEWIPQTVRQAEVSDVFEVEAGDDGSWCEHASGRPTGRRGHSMTINANDEVYIFGGATLKCSCEVDVSSGERSCSSKNVFSDELWNLDPLTAMFTRLERASEEEPWPQGREQHSATQLPNGDIIVIGGMTSADNNPEVGGDTALLADVWRMRDPHHISSHVVRSNDLNEDTPLELVPGHITSHGLSITLGDDEAETMCVQNLQLDISLEHNCLTAIEHIKLTGPEVDVAGHDAPQSRKYEAKVFVGSMESRETECQASSVNLTFSDGAEESVLSHPRMPTSGVFRPASSLLQSFGGLPASGQWEISIASTQPTDPEEYDGRLVNWELKVDVKPCIPQPNWEKLPSPPSFSARRLHTAVAVDGSIFVLGGLAQGRLNDLWRFDAESNTWTELNNASLRGQWRLYGQTAYLGPYGLLAYGGLKSHGPLKQGQDLWLLDLFEDDWVHVPIQQKNASSLDHGHFKNDLPHTRYLSSIGFLNDVDILYKRHNITDGKGPMALVFGGDGGLLHNAYPDSYGFLPNSFFDDVWLLSPGRIRVSGTMDQRSRESYCEETVRTTAAQTWSDGCGWDASFGGAPEECSLRDILTAAWCRGQYQSFYMS